MRVLFVSLSLKRFLIKYDVKHVPRIEEICGVFGEGQKVNMVGSFIPILEIYELFDDFGITRPEPDSSDEWSFNSCDAIVVLQAVSQ